jgi:UDP-N-acetylmuramoyl-tripeptide--D-alanyl-D-alanine ligase
VHYSKGSFNNHWGVPMSLLQLRPEHEVALIEMGMNHPGELRELCAIAEPDVVMVTMVGRGHLEGLGSIEGVATAKAEIYEASPRALPIFNIENEHTRKMAERFASAQALRFAGLTSAQAAQADVALEVVDMQPESMRVRGRIRGVDGEATVAVFGAQNITNLMAAAALALTAGLTPQEIWLALPLCRTIWGRNQWVKLTGSGARVLFDGYNANPESMGAAIDNFRRLHVRGRKFAILAEMKEMGSAAPGVHRELGELVARAGFEGVCFFGPSGREFEAGLQAVGFSKSVFISEAYEQTLAPRMLPVLEGNDIVLMKGSRSMQLEKALLDLRPIDFQAKK